MVKILVFDLDGTLLNDQKELSLKTKNYLQKKKEEGYIIVIATGRMFQSVLNVTENAYFCNYIISDTGALIYDNQKKEVIFRKNIAKEVFDKFFDYYDEKCFCIEACDQNKIYWYKKSINFHNDKISLYFNDKNELLNEIKDITQASIYMNKNKDIKKIYYDMTKKFPELSVFIMQESNGKKKWIESQVKGCSKYNAIIYLKEKLKLNNCQIIAFGDSLNDLEMLEKCDVGVAMKNALVDVKKVAKYVTEKTNNENGVVEFLEKYLDLE
ncbi:MAG: HAD family hydrolase [Firmicutes bacterium]|nr:HAD family hydrolase [Bacillota bacterium]